MAFDATTYLLAVKASNGGGGSGGLTMDLLWENANPRNSFTRQTVSVAISNYDFVMIVYSEQNGTGSVGQDGLCSAILPVANDQRSYLVVPRGDYMFKRDCTLFADSNQVLFENGESKAWTAQSYTQNNYVAKPLKVYGIK